MFEISLFGKKLTFVNKYEYEKVTTYHGLPVAVVDDTEYRTGFDELIGLISIIINNSILLLVNAAAKTKTTLEKSGMI